MIDEDKPCGPPPPLEVIVTGPVSVVPPNPVRMGPCFDMDIAANTDPEQVLGADVRRHRAVLIADGAVRLHRARSSAYMTWPASVALEIRHSDEIWASATSGVTIAVLTETSG